MRVTICATYNISYNQVECAVFCYEVPNKHCKSKEGILSLFTKIAQDFASETDDDYALSEIECGFDWGSFNECIDDEFLARYGVVPIDCSDEWFFTVDHDVAMI